MYSILVASEFIGPTNQARIADLGINNNETHMAGWVAYENNQPVRYVQVSAVANQHVLPQFYRVLLMNYMSDESGAHDYTARLAVNNRQSVSVRCATTTRKMPAAHLFTPTLRRYLEAPTITSKFGVHYANQTHVISLFHVTTVTLTIGCFTGGAATSNPMAIFAATSLRMWYLAQTASVPSKSRHLAWPSSSSPTI